MLNFDQALALFIPTANLNFMPEQNSELNALLAKIAELTRRHNQFADEIEELKAAARRLQQSSTVRDTVEQKPVHSMMQRVIQQKETGSAAAAQQRISKAVPKKPQPILPEGIKRDFEKFVGENLLSKIGIIILVIGVGIGAKYSIDHDLISPLARIILGYVAGIVLLFLGMRLKTKYLQYSAVLVSGAIAILYFITYLAFDLYALFPQPVAFAVMLLCTIFGVVAALNYNQQVIALIGLAGAYAVPFLLSNGSGNLTVLFAYMAIINTGLLIIALKKYWKLVYIAAFTITWLIVLHWLFVRYEANLHFSVALVFTSVFFLLFYGIFIAYKLARTEKLNVTDVALLLANSFIYYAVGFYIIHTNLKTENLAGVYTLANAILHFLVCTIIYKRKLADKNLFYLVSGLVLVFLTMAMPVQMDGNWVTLLWAFEATLLFYLAKKRNAKVFEKFSYVLMVVAFISISQDWATYYSTSRYDIKPFSFTPVLNIHYLTTLIVAACFFYIYSMQRRQTATTVFLKHPDLNKLVTLLVPGIALLCLYYGTQMEIANYWNLQFDAFENFNRGNRLPVQTEPILWLKDIWIINYSLLFVSLLLWVNIRFVKSRTFGFVSVIATGLCIAMLLTQGLASLTHYAMDTPAGYLPFDTGLAASPLRYYSFACAAIALYACYLSLKKNLPAIPMRKIYDGVLHISVLAMLSTELIIRLQEITPNQSDKLALSILFGVYALFVIILGIWQHKKHLRIGGIALFGITFIKLFLYDITHLNSISKTIVFVCLGILLLIVSFLYNKYKHIIINNETA